jgi:hypothetical protein
MKNTASTSRPTRPARKRAKCECDAYHLLHRGSQFLPRSNSATKALGKLQHLDWKDAGEALDRPDLAGVMMPSGKAKDMSSTFPQPSIKVEDNWNEVRLITPLHGSIYSRVFWQYIVYDVAQIRTRYLLMVQFG